MEVRQGLLPQDFLLQWHTLAGLSSQRSGLTCCSSLEEKELETARIQVKTRSISESLLGDLSTLLLLQLKRCRSEKYHVQDADTDNL